MFTRSRNSGTVLPADSIQARRLEFTLRRQAAFRAGVAAANALASAEDAALADELAADADWRSSWLGQVEAVAAMLAVPMDPRTRAIAEQIIREDRAAEDAARASAEYDMAQAEALAANPFLAQFAVVGA